MGGVEVQIQSSCLQQVLLRLVIQEGRLGSVEGQAGQVGLREAPGLTQVQLCTIYFLFIWRTFALFNVAS